MLSVVDLIRTAHFASDEISKYALDPLYGEFNRIKSIMEVQELEY